MQEFWTRLVTIMSFSLHVCTPWHTTPLLWLKSFYLCVNVSFHLKTTPLRRHTPILQIISEFIVSTLIHRGFDFLPKTAVNEHYYFLCTVQVVQNHLLIIVVTGQPPYAAADGYLADFLHVSTVQVLNVITSCSWASAFSCWARMSVAAKKTPSSSNCATLSY